jgi:hypothetical protein
MSNELGRVVPRSEAADMPFDDAVPWYFGVAHSDMADHDHADQLKAEETEPLPFDDEEED